MAIEEIVKLSIGILMILIMVSYFIYHYISDKNKDRDKVINNLSDLPKEQKYKDHGSFKRKI